MTTADDGRGSWHIEHHLTHGMVSLITDKNSQGCGILAAPQQIGR
jgi:hypothetical protein